MTTRAAFCISFMARAFRDACSSICITTLLEDPVMNELDDIVTLAEAAELLGRAQTTMRNQVHAGRLRARLIGKTWVTTRAEVERYRAESLGQAGRPKKS